MTVKTLILTGFFLVLSIPAVKAATYDRDYVGEMEVHTAVFEDTLVHLARWNDLGFVEMMAANPELDPWIPGAGAKVILPKQHLLPDAPRKGIVINLPEMHLFFFPEDGSAPTVHSIGIGREGLNTPIGKTTVTRKKAGPTWRPTARMREEDPSLPAVVPPGPENPLGTHALYLGFPQYLIHGTNKPYGIGRRISSGCIRMYPETIRELFDRVPVGTPVNIVDQPIKVGWIDDKM
ncbi:MAG: L,D-transpeptidase family protein, partial [Pseudomonadota bacterium]